MRKKGYFDENAVKIKESFEILSAYTKEKYQDLHLALGNELRYNLGCVDWLTMNNTNYVLVDFSEGEVKISQGLDRILNRGYIPILAHAERYTKIRGNIGFLKVQSDNGVLIQIYAMSILGDFGCLTKSFANKILKKYIADFVSSDAHGLNTIPPGIRETYEIIEKIRQRICRSNMLKKRSKYDFRGMKEENI